MFRIILIILPALLLAGCRTYQDAALSACRGSTSIPLEKGVSEAPPSQDAIADIYRRGGPFSHEELTLRTDGHYTTEAHGCGSKYAEAAGTWELAGTQVVLTPSTQTGRTNSPLRTLDVLRFRGDWILLRPEAKDSHEKYGVRLSSSFQKKYK